MLQHEHSLGQKKYEHITPILASLHWLPVKSQIDFKILLITYQALNGLAPAYKTYLFPTTLLDP